MGETVLDASGEVGVASWRGGTQRLKGPGTAFVVACAPAALWTSRGTFPLSAGSYAVVPGVAHVEGGAGLSITAARHRGLFMVGGPVEAEGRLRYIDGCSDTVLVAPIVRGDPCLNFLHLPAGVVQHDHEHPSLRVGIVLRGAGICVVGRTVAADLRCGTVFVLEPGTVHRFESRDEPLDIVAWHPDSAEGPTDDDHPMLNRTLRPGTSRRMR